MTVNHKADILSREHELARLHPAEILEIALTRYSPQIAIAFSGAEDIVLINMATKVGLPFRVFSLDTGRLHAETYEYIERIRDRYKLKLEIVFPKPESIEKLVREKGLFSFYRDGHKECCQIRKVEPLRRALADAKAWVTGLRRDQSPSTRATVPVVESDHPFRTAGQVLLKFNPLAHWSSKQVWAYIREHRLPFNPLHERGFVSIGCQPCTRPVLPGQHEREGRWWWEDETRRECGLHMECPPKSVGDSISNPRPSHKAVPEDGENLAAGSEEP
jgi:phosphoadenosine phosphosulfate reductase